MEQYTPEPWGLRDDYKGSVYLREQCVARCCEPQSEANASRIAACVNACAGIPTEQLDAYPGAVMRVMKERDELLASERKLSDAYIRLREKLSAFDTPTAPTAEQVYAHTESKLNRLLEQRDELLAALEDVKIYLQDTQAKRHIYDRVIKAITSVKCGAA